MYFLRARLTDCIPMSGGGFAATTGTKSDLFASFNPCTGPPSFWPCMSDPSRRLGLSCMGSWMSFFSCVVTCTFCTAASLFDKRTSSSANSFRRHAFTCELSHAWIFSTLGNSLGAGPWQLCVHACMAFLLEFIMQNSHMKTCFRSRHTNSEPRHHHKPWEGALPKCHLCMHEQGWLWTCLEGACYMYIAWTRWAVGWGHFCQVILLWDHWSSRNHTGITSIILHRTGITSIILPVNGTLYISKTALAECKALASESLLADDPESESPLSSSSFPACCHHVNC